MIKTQKIKNARRVREEFILCLWTLRTISSGNGCWCGRERLKEDVEVEADDDNE